MLQSDERRRGFEKARITEDNRRSYILEKTRETERGGQHKRR